MKRTQRRRPQPQSRALTGMHGRDCRRGRTGRVQPASQRHICSSTGSCCTFSVRAFWFIWQKCTLFNLCETDGMNQHQRFFVYLSTFNQPDSCKPSSATSSTGIQLLHQHHQRLDFLFTSLNITSSRWSLYKCLRKRGDKSSYSLKTLRVSPDWNTRMILT